MICHAPRKTLLLILWSITVSATGAFAQQDASNLFPYQAIVSTADAEVHSGPGSVHYVTAKLSQGDSLEVYRHDPGGWCAIRPVKGSFSLIPATAVEELGNGVGEIVEDGTQAWVGTQLGPVDKPLWQVKLKSGEQVTLLGIATWPDPDGFTTSWYQIEPPAGEFRWIKLDQLKVPDSVTSALLAQQRQANPHTADNHSPADSAATPDRDPLTLQAGFESEIGATGEVGLTSYSDQDPRGSTPRYQRNEMELKSTGTGWRKARFPFDRTNPASRAWSNTADHPVGLNSPPQPGNNLQPDRYASANLAARYEFDPAASASTPGFQSSRSALTGPLSPRMTELELKLNQEVIKEPNLWSLSELQAAAQQVVATSSDGAEQDQARRFLTKLDNCLYLRDQYIRRSSPGMAPLTVDNRPVSTLGDLSLDTLYDAHGWLKELVRDGGRAEPTYVLQNEAGKVTHHVLAGPGMNLSSYVSKRIGIIGQRGYHTRLKLDHVTAEKVIELK